MADEKPPREQRLRRILVVDDEELVGGAVRRALSPNHEVLFLTQADAALDKISGGERFDLILCDLMMPKMSGMEFHARLSVEVPDQAQNMVFLTGGAFTPASRAFLQKVPNERIEKPFDVDTLLDFVAKRLG